MAKTKSSREENLSCYKPFIGNSKDWVMKDLGLHPARRKDGL